MVRSFDDVLAEAAAADVTGWGVDWLDDRATEERPPWGYATLLADRLGRVGSALDIDTGSGEVLAEAPLLPPRMVATEAWPPNAWRARELLGPRGVEVLDTAQDAPLPVPGCWGGGCREPQSGLPGSSRRLPLAWPPQA
ncbi:MAG: hypothetical protein ACRDQA_03705 [Nocardioidaceae bacterium]